MQGGEVLDGRDLGISINYKANVAFELEPTVVTVEAEKSEMYKYFQEQKRIGAGFWIFNYSSVRNKIREKFEKDGHLHGRIRFGDRELTDQIGGAEYLKNLLVEAKNRAVDFMADIEVARTPGEAPLSGYLERPGRVTLWWPKFYWSFSLFGSYGESKVDIERVSKGRYSEEYHYEGTEDLPIGLVSQRRPRSSLSSGRACRRSCRLQYAPTAVQDSRPGRDWRFRLCPSAFRR